MIHTFAPMKVIFHEYVKLTWRVVYETLTISFTSTPEFSMHFL